MHISRKDSPVRGVRFGAELRNDVFCDIKIVIQN